MAAHNAHVRQLLAPFLVAHPWLGLPANIWVIYAELAAFIVAFRPALPKLWASC